MAYCAFVLDGMSWYVILFMACFVAGIAKGYKQIVRVLPGF
jgi:hypothetical protein